MKKIKCSCKEEMNRETLHVQFPKGTLPSKGYKCNKCGKELISLDEVKKIQEKAEKQGYLTFQKVKKTVKKSLEDCDFRDFLSMECGKCIIYKIVNRIESLEYKN